MLKKKRCDSRSVKYHSINTTTCFLYIVSHFYVLKKNLLSLVVCSPTDITKSSKSVIIIFQFFKVYACFQ